MHPINADDTSDVTTLIQLTRSIFAGLNIGLLVYYLQDPTDPTSLTLMYANEEASHYTKADLQKRVGKKIHDAFPALANTDLPGIYASVATERKSRELGVVAYEDDAMEKSYYAVKAFPMPNDCVGIAFENIALRKKVEEMVKQLNEALKQKNKEQEKLVAIISQDLTGPAHEVHTYAAALRNQEGRGRTEEETALLDKLVDASNRVAEIVDALVTASRQ